MEQLRLGWNRPGYRRSSREARGLQQSNGGEEGGGSRWNVARTRRALWTFWNIPGGSLAAVWTRSGRDGKALGKPVRRLLKSTKEERREAQTQSSIQSHFITSTEATDSSKDSRFPSTVRWVWTVTAAMKLKIVAPCKKSYDKLRQHIKKAETSLCWQRSL